MAALAPFVTPAESTIITPQVDDQNFQTANISQTRTEVKEGHSKHSRSVTSKDGLDVNIEKILDLMDEIILSGSSLKGNHDN